MSYNTFTLPNGLRIIHAPNQSNVAYCGFAVDAGTRDENEQEQGMAHFVEHLIFKGTQKRHAWHILNRMENVGGDLNAYTNKEETVIYSAFLVEHFSRAAELLADIVFHSTFPQHEIDKEVEVIIDEIQSYEDSPSELIFDDFEELIYTGYPIGRNILGDEASVERISRDMVLDFVKRNYFPNRMVISSVGDIPFEKLVRLVEKYFSPYEVGSPLRTRIKPEIYTPRFVEMDKDTHQSHCIIGNVAYDYTEDNRLALSLLMNLLGGTGMNSRLNLNIREKYGLAYNIEASYTPYSDTGVSMIYFGCDPENAEWCLNLCKKEMRALYEEKLGPLQLKRAKAQMVGQLAISSENYENLMLSIGKSFLIYDKVDSLEDIYTQIEEITPELLIRVAKEIFDVDKQSVLLYK